MAPYKFPYRLLALLGISDFRAKIQVIVFIGLYSGWSKFRLVLDMTFDQELAI